ncbi:MAG: HPF/RaiA family ribosome-associated protein [Minisyncoccia bacterium]
MQIFFQTKKVNITQGEQDFMARRIEGLEKFFSPHAHAYIDVEKTRASHNGHDLYYVAIKIDDAPHRYFAEEYQADTRTAFDHAYGDLYRVIRNDRSKSRSMLKSAGRKFKQIFKRKAK